MNDRRLLRGLALAYWTAYVLALVYFASRATIDYYDAFEYLRNARTLAGRYIGYSTYRPPLLPLLHAPMQWLFDRAGAGMSTRLLAPHLLHALLSLGCLAAFYAVLRRSFSAGWAQIGTILLSLDRVMIHYSFFAMTDVPCALLLLLTLRYAARPREGRAASAAAVAVLSALLLCRWNMLVIPAGLVAWSLLRDRGGARRVAAVSAAALAVFAVVNIAIFRYVNQSTLGEAWRFLGEVLSQGGGSQFDAGMPRGSVWSYAVFTAVGPGLVAVGLALLGLAAPAEARLEEAVFHAALFVGFAAVMSAVSHKEARFLIPALPALYFTALRGLQALESWGRRAVSPAAGAALASAVLVGAFARGTAEWLRFRDPVYRSPILLETARTVERLAPAGGRLLWSGTAFTMLPREGDFAADDPMFYAYHVPSLASLEYLLGRLFPKVSGPSDFRDGDLVVAAPARVGLPSKPLTSEERRLDILAVEGTSLRPIAGLRPR